MELSDYINLTLSEIAKGVEKANKPYARKNKDFILSETSLRIKGFPSVNWDDNYEATYKPIIKVAFRIGVEVEETTAINGKMGGSLKVISANSESATKDGKRSVHEVCFELPLILPQ